MVPNLSAAYRRFWHEVGETFPDLGGAASTAYYFENEKRLLSEHLPDLGRSAVLKTDLWDEVKNTRILQWVHAQGASVYGVDISEPTVRQARAAFTHGGLRAAAADVRSLPFRDRSFDAIYSMGTIEHFPESETALREMHRVLRPGGRAVVGVKKRNPGGSVTVAVVANGPGPPRALEIETFKLQSRVAPVRAKSCSPAVARSTSSHGKSA